MIPPLNVFSPPIVWALPVITPDTVPEASLIARVISSGLLTVLSENVTPATAAVAEVFKKLASVAAELLTVMLSTPTEQAAKTNNVAVTESVCKHWLTPPTAVGRDRE